MGSCLRNNKEKVIAQTSEDIADNKIDISPFNPIIIDAIIGTLIYLDSLGHDIDPEVKMVNLIIGDNLIYITTTPYYEKGIKGYGYLDKYTVGYYGNDNELIGRFINLDKITKYNDTIPGFSERFKKYGYDIFDPYGIEYEVIKMDSLTIKRKGML